MENIGNFLQNLDDLTSEKKRKKILEKQKCCKTTFLIESDVQTVETTFSLFYERIHPENERIWNFLRNVFLIELVVSHFGHHGTRQ